MRNKRKSPYDPLLFQGIAHRGLHDAVSTENGMGAFQKAVDAGVAIECDVHLSKDKHLVVCHDSSLLRTTGKEGVIEDLTLSEIKEGYRLLDGGEVPTFQELYDLVQERVPLVIELKTKDRNYFALARQAKKEFAQVKDPSKLVVISFDPRALLWVSGCRHSTGLLVTDTATWVIQLGYKFDFMDVQDTLVDHPKVQRLREKGHLLNVWTIDTEEKLQKVLPHVDMITFQDMPLSHLRDSLAKRNG